MTGGLWTLAAVLIGSGVGHLTRGDRWSLTLVGQVRHCPDVAAHRNLDALPLGGAQQMINNALGRHTWSWPARWTWCAPFAVGIKVPTRSGGTLVCHRRRNIDYALEPEPRLLGELLRRGFLEGA